MTKFVVREILFWAWVPIYCGLMVVGMLCTITGIACFVLGDLGDRFVEGK